MKKTDFRPARERIDALPKDRLDAIDAEAEVQKLLTKFESEAERADILDQTVDQLKRQMKDALTEIQRLESIVTKIGGWGFTPYLTFMDLEMKWYD